MSKINGIVRIKVDGYLLESKPDAELDLGGFERELKSGHRVYGYTEKVVPSKLTCTIFWKNSTPLEVLRNITNGLITFESDNGKTYQVSEAVLLMPPKPQGETGECPLEFGGNAAEEQ